MEQLPDMAKMLGVIIGLPVYLYLLVRILTSAIVRSYYETKQTFNK